MITEWDDLLVHQSASTLDRVESDDPRWHDRHWLLLGDTRGEVLLGVGLGVYPNRGVMDGFACATCGGAQYNVLVSRELGSERATQVGPLQLEVERGLRRIRARLAPNAHAVGFDLAFESLTPPFEERTHEQRDGERWVRRNARYNQAGRWSGALDVAGRHFEVTPDRFFGERDRSWGLRPGQGEPPPAKTQLELGALLAHSGFGLYHYNPAQFPGYALFYMLYETPQGAIAALDGGLRFPWDSARAGDVVRVTGARHQMEFAPGTRSLTRASVELALEDGREKRYAVTPLLPCFLAQGGGYGDPVRWHGSSRGKLVVEGSRFDLGDAEARRQLGYANDYFAEWRCDDGEVGYGQFEYVIGASERFGFPAPEPR